MLFEPHVSMGRWSYAALVAMLLAAFLASGCTMTIGGGFLTNTAVLIVNDIEGLYANLSFADRYGGGPVRNCQQLLAGETPHCIFRPRGGISLYSVRGQVLIQLYRIGTGEYVGSGELSYYARTSRYGYGNYPVYRIRKVDPVVASP